MRAFSIGVIAVSAMLFFVPARAQHASTDEQHQHSQAAAQPTGMDPQKMMAEMKAADDRLQALAEKMTTAKGDDKVQAIQDVVSELVKNQIAMHQRMAMQEHMMSQMPKK